MIESAAVIALIVDAVETLAIPALGAWLTSEAVGLSKSKHNSLLGMAVGIAKAVVRELAEETPASAVVTPKARKTPQRNSKGRFQKAVTD